MFYALNAKDVAKAIHNKESYSTLIPINQSWVLICGVRFKREFNTGEFYGETNTPVVMEALTQTLNALGITYTAIPTLDKQVVND